MNVLVLLADKPNLTWYLLPIALLVSLVYSASRYELTSRILRHAAWCFVRIVALMAVVLVVLWWLSFRL